MSINEMITEYLKTHTVTKCATIEQHTFTPILETAELVATNRCDCRLVKIATA